MSEQARPKIHVLTPRNYYGTLPLLYTHMIGFALEHSR